MPCSRLDSCDCSHSFLLLTEVKQGNRVQVLQVAGAWVPGRLLGGESPKQWYLHWVILRARYGLLFFYTNQLSGFSITIAGSPPICPCYHLVWGTRAAPFISYPCLGMGIKPSLVVPNRFAVVSLTCPFVCSHSIHSHFFSLIKKNTKQNKVCKRCNFHLSFHAMPLKDLPHHPPNLK